MRAPQAARTPTPTRLLSITAAPRCVAPRVAVGAHSYYYGGGGYYHSYYSHPYYAFHPHVSLGFGLWLGYPVAYPYYSVNPYAAAYPYAYPADPYAYGAPAPAYGAPAPAYGYPAQPSYDPYQSSAQGYPQQPAPSVGVQRGNRQPTSSGVSFEITPANADVFVDGRQIGQAGEFGPTSRPLDLNPGHHRVEIRASGLPHDELRRGGHRRTGHPGAGHALEHD